MALSDEQKAQKKADRAAHEKAYRARQRQLHKAIQAVDELPQVVEAKKAFDEACNLQDDLIRRCNAEEESLRLQIAKLQEQLNNLRRDNPDLKEASQKRNTLGDVWRAAKAVAEAEVSRQFPDLVGDARTSSYHWKPLGDN